MEEYAYKSLVHDFYKSVDAQTMGQELKKIEEKYGYLQPKYILEEAKRDNHPLHNCFEWSDNLAAQKWRETQARSMLRVVVIQKEYSSEPIRAFVQIREDGEGRYRNFEDVMIDPDEAQKQINQAKRELDKWIQKWNHLKTLDKYFKAIRDVETVAA